MKASSFNTTAQTQYAPTTAEQIEEALQYISPDMEREEWAKIGMSIKSEMGDYGITLFDTWSQGADNYKAADVKSTWRSINGKGGVGIGTLFHIAKEGGYQPEQIEVSPAQQAVFAQQAAARAVKRKAADAKEETARQKGYETAATLADKRLKKTTPADPGHDYLKPKLVDGIAMRQDGTTLMTAMQDETGKIWNIERITAKGKKGLTGGRRKGLFCRIPGSESIVIAEGVATAESCHMATGWTALCAFGKANLQAVAEIARRKKPDTRIVIAADVGSEKHAQQAAAAVDAEVAIPPLQQDGADFNDLHVAEGLDAVKQALEGAEDVNEWGEPGEITSQLQDVPKLPSALIPAPYREWICDIAHRMQTPADFAAITAITVTASVIGSACTIKPKEKDSWAVTPNLWGACIGRPSVVLKSPSMKEPMNMLGRLQAAAKDIYDSEVNAHEFEAKLAEAEEKKFNADLSKLVKSKTSTAAEIDQMRADFADAETIEKPVRRLYKTNETSIQSQTVLQNENPRGILTFRDELTGLLTRWDKHEHEDERAYFLEGWNGDCDYTDFKIGRGLTEADNICISLLGGIQPDKLWRYLHQSMNGGNDGLMQRFQLAVYPDEPKHWQLIDEYPNKEAKDRAFDALDTLDTLDYTSIAEKTEYDRAPFIRFTPEAQETFNKWLTELQPRLISEDNPVMGEHLGKYRSLMPSLALIFHLLDIADGAATGAVSNHAAILAAGWCEYLEAHARRIYGYICSPARAAATVLSSHIHQLPNPFTAKDVYRNHWHLLSDREKVEAACGVMIEENWLLMTTPESSVGRPPLPRYAINPAVLDQK